MLVYLVVFSVMWKAPDDRTVDHYWLFLLCGLPPWVFFATSLQIVRAQPAREREPDPQGALPAPARAALDRRDAARRVRRDARRSCSCSCVIVLAGLARATAWLAIPIGALDRPVRRRACPLRLPRRTRSTATSSSSSRRCCCRCSSSRPCSTASTTCRSAQTHPWLIDLIHWGNPLTPLVECFRAPLFFGERSVDRRLVYLARRDGRSPSCSARPCSGRSTTGSPRNCDGDAAVEQPVVALVGRQAEVRHGLDPVEQRGQQQRVREARVASAAAAPTERASRVGPAPVATRRPDGGPAFRVCVEQRRDQSGGGAAPATRCATASASVLDDRLLLRGERGRRDAGRGRRARARRARGSAIRGATSTSSSSGAPPTSANQKRCSSTRSNASR